jgi:hypothetical protein
MPASSLFQLAHREAAGAQHVVQAGEAHLVGAFEHRDQRGQRGLEQLHAAFGAALHLQPAPSRSTSTMRLT